MPGRGESDPRRPRGLTSREDWEKDLCGRVLSGPVSDFPELLGHYLPKDKTWTVLEVGACPGAQLLAIALSHGYHPVALDYLPAVRQLPGAFARFGVPGLEVIEADFLDFETSRRFEVVMSYGFIEHFAEPEEVIRRQWDLVAEGGYLVLGSPAFGPLQLALRRLVLKPAALEATLRAHNRRIMGAEAIARAVRQFAGAAIVRAAYAGQMKMWFAPRDRDVRRGRAWILGVWHALGRVPKWLKWSSPLFSPLCLVIARKSAGTPSADGSPASHPFDPSARHGV